MTPPKKVRLHKFMAECGVSSRRKAEALIARGNVCVNGNVVTTPGTQIDPERDLVTVDGVSVQREAPVLYRFHKPRKVVCTMSDPEGRPCIADYLKNIAERLFPVGRLDFDVSGLLLLTNDGEYADALLHPRNEVPRTYWAMVRGTADDRALEKLTRGIRLEDGRARAVSARTLPESAQRTRLFGRGEEGTSYLEVVVAEGRKHFVKRLLKAAGYPVLSLSRVRFGDYELASLRPGELRKAAIFRAVSGGSVDNRR